MPFPSTLSGGQITQVRTLSQDFEHYLLATPNDIVWQAQVNETKSGQVYAEIDWITTLQGVRTNVIEGQLLYITSAADDFTAPIIRGRVRKVPDATDVFINEVAIDIDTSMFITVIDDFDIQEKLIRVNAAGTQFKDWDLTWEDLPPIISGLQSVYVDFSESDPVAFTFSPSAIAPSSGAAISTWLWDIGDGSFTGGTSSSDQNIQCTFPGYGTNEHRWVHLTVTDDNGNDTTIHFEVFTVAKSSSTASKLDAGQVSINGTLAEGWNATITAWSGFANTIIWNQNRMTIASIDNYAGTATPIVSNIMFVGRLRTENDPTSADELDGVIVESQLQIEGFATQLSRIPSPRLPIFDEDSPDSWGEITDPTLTRLAAYVWAFHSTLLGISSITFDDFSTFISDEFKIEDSTLLDVINSDANSVNGQVVFAPSGEITIRRNNNYLSTSDRNARDTIFDFQTQDITRYQLDIEYGQSIGQVVVGALVYDTTLDEISSSWIGRAPPQSFGVGHETSTLNGQILVADSTDANARSEVAQRTANHLAYINPKPRLTVTLIDGFWWLIPTIHQWYTFTLPASTNARSRAYTTNDRWLLIDVSYSPVWDDAEKVWLRETTATFELETTSTNAAIDVSIVPPLNDNLFAPPPNSGYMSFPKDPLIDYPTDSPSLLIASVSSSYATEPTPQNQNNDSEPGAEVLNIPLAVAKTVSTTRDSVLGETYLVEVDGDGIVFDDVWVYKPDFRNGFDGWVTSSDLGVQTAGVGYEDTDETSGTTRQRGVRTARKNFTAANLTRVDIRFDYVRGNVTNPNNTAFDIHGNIWASNPTPFSDPNVATGTGKLHRDEQTITGETQINLTVISDSKESPFTFIGDVTLYRAEIAGTGTPPPEFTGVTNPRRGDAFYSGYDTDGGASLYSGSNGLQVDGARPSGIPPFNSSHVYRFQITGTGDPFDFSFADDDYTDNDNNILRVKIAGPNMGNTA
jgi:hypothetical protein